MFVIFTFLSFQLHRLLAGHTATLYVHGYDRRGCGVSSSTAYLVLLTGTRYSYIRSCHVTSIPVCRRSDVMTGVTATIAGLEQEESMISTPRTKKDPLSNRYQACITSSSQHRPMCIAILMKRL